MKFFLLFLFISSAIAQTSQVSKARELVNAAKKIADEQGTVTQIKTLTDKSGISYPVLVVSAVRGNELNNEAERVSRLFGGLPLIYSPYDLSRSGANAFFDPAGKMLGVPYGFVVGDYNNSSYLHELYHASTYQKVLNGQNPLWAGVMKVLKGDYLSSRNTEYYTRFVSLDELPATALSLRLEALNLLQLRRTQTPQEFNRSRGAADSLLGEVYFSANVGRHLARQVQEVLTRALSTQSSSGTTQLSLGRLKKNLPTVTLIMDSYRYPNTGGRSTLLAEPQGSEIKLYSSTALTSSSLKNRLTTLISRARQAEAAFERAQKCVYVMIDYPKLDKTDYGCLEREAGKAFSLLDTI